MSETVKLSSYPGEIGSVDRSDALLRAVIEKSAEVISLTAADGTIRYLTPVAAATVLGWTPEDMLTLTPRDQVIPEDRTRLEAELALLVQSGARDMALDFRVRHKDGSIRWIESTGTNLLDDPAVRAIVGNYRDITARKHAENALRTSEERYRRIVETTSDGVWTYDGDGITTFMNRRMAAILGCSVDEAIGASVYTFIDAANQEAARGRAEKRKQGIAATEEIPLRRKDGSEVWVSVRGDAMFDAEGRFEAGLAVVTDMTVRREVETALRRTEEQLRQSQKMDAIGRLAGGVAHDFNNLLSVVLGYSEMVLADLKEDDPHRADLEEIQRAGERAADLTRQLLLFSRQQAVETKVLVLNDILADMDKMLRRLVGEDVTLTCVLGPTAGSVRVDTGSLEQVIMNLAINARDAMPVGGKLTMETAQVVLDEEYEHGHLGAKPGSYMMLSVTDTGVGMDKPTQARLFEPFFTTKEHGKGTGLGLATVFGIVQRAGGSIWVYSEPGLGTAFKVYLPCVESATGEGPPVGEAPPLHRGETILLVEDDVQVRHVACGILLRHGYTVLEAASADDAVRLCDGHPGPVDLLLSDIVMPAVSGPVLAKQLAQLRPGMKVLFMSGYTDDAAVRHGVIDASFAYIQKPLTVGALTKKVRAVLDG
jgi:two-component system cell cycle sensor histidine kinase/response regulator CckA